MAYAPYGEEYNGSGTQDLDFTDQNQDTVKNGWSTNLYDFMFREYRTAHGRWSSPDPAGLDAVNPTNPQTWNRYGYVLNNPLILIDPLGQGSTTFSGFEGNCYIVDIKITDSNSHVISETTFTVYCLDPSTGAGANVTGPTTNPGPGQNGGGSGDGAHIGPAPGPHVSAKKPTICSANDLIFRSFDFSLKFGLEANVGNVLKLGGSFFKNLTTGETGASVGAKVVVGYELGTKNPPGVPLTTPGSPVTHTGSVGPFERNFTTGENSVNLSIGFALGIGGEASFNPRKFWDLLGQCDVIVD